jgi:hypothetical protein
VSTVMCAMRRRLRFLMLIATVRRNSMAGAMGKPANPMARKRPSFASKRCVANMKSI